MAQCKGRFVNFSENMERFRGEFLRCDFCLALVVCYHSTLGQQPTHGHIINVQGPREDVVSYVRSWWGPRPGELHLGARERADIT